MRGNMGKRIVMICFFDRVSLSIRLLSSVAKKNGHETFLIYFKDDRAIIIDKFRDKSDFFQLINNGQYLGCGADVNYPTEEELTKLTEKVKEIDPDVVCVSTRSATKELSKKVVQLLRRAVPDAIYLAGGYGPTMEPEAFLDVFDCACVGEGEPVFEHINNDFNLSSFDKVPNLVFRKDGRVLYNQMTDPVNLDDLPFLDWEPQGKFLVEDGKVLPMEGQYDQNSYDIFASRGCPSKCTYCMANQWQNFYIKHGNRKYPKLRLRSPKSVIDELKYAKAKYQIEYVRFLDSIFGCSKKWLYEFLDLYDAEIALSFKCNLDVRYVDADLIKRLKESFMVHTVVGIQGVSEKTRQYVLGRHITDKRIIDYAWLLEEFGVQFHYDILHWNPFDTEETLLDGKLFLDKLPKNKEASIIKLLMLPGSKLSEFVNRNRPTPLANDIFLYWAWIYMMVLRGQNFDTIVNAILELKPLRRHPDIIREIYKETVREEKMGNLLIARREIRKGENVTPVMLDFEMGRKTEGIEFDERKKLINLVANKNIGKGVVLQWDYFFYSYGHIRK